MVLLSADENISRVFIIGDNIRVCDAADLKDGFLVLLAVYFLLNLNYPPQFAQLLGLLHSLCLRMEFAVKDRSAAFSRFHDVVAF